MFFDAFNALESYESRLVAHDDLQNGCVVDTCRVSDSDQPYETGVKDSRYYGGSWVIVELYPTEEAARGGHARWVQTMSAPEPPAMLVDVSSSEAAKFVDSAFGSDDWRANPLEGGISEEKD